MYVSSYVYVMFQRNKTVIPWEFGFLRRKLEAIVFFIEQTSDIVFQ